MTQNKEFVLRAMAKEVAESAHATESPPLGGAHCVESISATLRCVPVSVQMGHARTRMTHTEPVVAGELLIQCNVKLVDSRANVHAGDRVEASWLFFFFKQKTAYEI